MAGANSQSGQGFEELSAEEKAKVGRLNELSEQFMSGDKYCICNTFMEFLISSSHESVY